MANLFQAPASLCVSTLQIYHQLPISYCYVVACNSPSGLLIQLRCCHPNRISYIVMIGQVLQLLGCTSNSMFTMGCQMAGLYLPSTILNLEQIKLVKQWHIVIRLQLWVPVFCFIHFIKQILQHINKLYSCLFYTVLATLCRFQTHIRRKCPGMVLSLLTILNSMAFGMALILIFGIHIMTTSSRYNVTIGYIHHIP